MADVRLLAENGSTAEPTRCFEEHEIKHLELVQGVISRMAQHSFQLKGWSVTVATAAVALATRESSLGLAVIALFPAIAFWCLDAHYLRQERLYRKLHEAIADPLKVVRPFSMMTQEYEREVEPWVKTLGAKTVLALHGAVALVIFAEILAFLIRVGLQN